MVAAGVPTPRPDHASALALMALDMLDAMGASDEVGHEGLELRIGINSGPVVAGVIGRKRFLYDLWGDAVNTASRMESHGTPGRIQITRATYELLGDAFVCEPRGPVPVKGKGDVEAWYVLGRRTPIADRRDCPTSWRNSRCAGSGSYRQGGPEIARAAGRHDERPSSPGSFLSVVWSLLSGGNRGRDSCRSAMWSLRRGRLARGRASAGCLDSDVATGEEECPSVPAESATGRNATERKGGGYCRNARPRCRRRSRPPRRPGARASRTRATRWTPSSAATRRSTSSAGTSTTSRSSTGGCPAPRASTSSPGRAATTGPPH